ncbi:hypothetical protein P872_11905 [Rhodonellum psychrophilum GCM71 = DSM 17998]|uniref:Carboxyltransferase domain-containing protein n=2 Tax=Rhodonellum TaxID=336827 RepID=U5BTL0_9BACT|nr:MULTISPECIES: 5-oxoprolinase subunit PxpB [Rhodonellum]ERM80854.1 hypothetical protein P872_11905 [Rhodonellum psychrophilum GCM71 = DSM 17998]MDO9554645.1 5-oxoprolinase subunit PxpB [Rhodonellum sp.]SDZ52544.1 sensor histidine kinase inhibitor, KipI family [Rhodonellum ikkaensis]
MEKTFFIVHPKLIEISWPAKISKDILFEQLAWKDFLEKHYGKKLEEARLGFNTLSLAFLDKTHLYEWDIVFHHLLSIKADDNTYQGSCWIVPVCYEKPFAKDLSFVAENHNMTENQVIQLHSERPYLLHFYGFLPGFMYLGGLNEGLYTPRKSSPDRMIKAGSVAIGGEQTGIYPCESPGGWQVIGRSPLSFFDIGQKIPTKPQIGDEVKFEPISVEKFKFLQEQVPNPHYEWQHD